MDKFFEWISEILSSFFKKLGVDISAASLLILLLGLGLITPYLIKGVKFLKNFFRGRRLSKRLYPFYQPWEINDVIKYFVDTRWQKTSPAMELELFDSLRKNNREKVIPFLLNEFRKEGAKDKFYIILADAGMGKTTFLINLYKAYLLKINKKYNIKLLPLSYAKVDDEISKIDKPEETIILLDAFDEDMEAVKDYKVRMDNLMELVWKFRFVIITCRTQFFPNEFEEPRKTKIRLHTNGGGFYEFNKMYLSPFSDEDIDKYLRNRYPIINFWTKQKRKKGKEIADKSPNLMVRPMLLSYIDDLLISGKSYSFVYEIYEELISKWVDRESKNNSQDSKYYCKQLYKFSNELAFDIYTNRVNRGGLFIDGNKIGKFADEYGINLTEINLKSRSLLNRDTIGNYKFSHKSILEYLLALRAKSDDTFKRVFSFEGLNYAEVFLNEMVLGKNAVLKPLLNEDLIGILGYEGRVISFCDVKIEDVGKMEFMIISDYEHINDIEIVNKIRRNEKFENKFELFIAFTKNHPKIIREAISRSFKQNGALKVGFIPRLLASVNGTFRNYKKDKFIDSVLVIELGKYESAIGIITGGQVFDEKELVFSFKDIKDSIQRELNTWYSGYQLTDKDLDELIIKIDNSDYMRVDVILNFNNIKDLEEPIPCYLARDLMESLERDLTSFTETLSGDTYSEILNKGGYFSGICANIKGLEIFLSTVLNLPIYLPVYDKYNVSCGILYILKQEDPQKYGIYSEKSLVSFSSINEDGI